MRLSKTEIQERYRNLPDALREAVFSTEITETLLTLGKKYNLSIEKIGELHTETNYIIFGISHPRDFIRNIQKATGVDALTAKNIAQEVNTLIFANIRDELKKLHGIKEETGQEGITPSKSPHPPQAIKPLPTLAPSQPKEPSPLHRDLTPLPPIKEKEPLDFARGKPFDSAPSTKLGVNQGKQYSFTQLKKDLEKEQKPVNPPAPPEKTTALDKSLNLPRPDSEQAAQGKPFDSAPSTKLGVNQGKSFDPAQDKSPFQEKIKDDIFRQKPAESMRQDPYREPVEPHEKTLDANQHITRETHD
ncbi:MAG: hypothetical protein HY445_03530 [Candidatus Niyogibacteria bacterium]|nr:hypothetical protein [Candidatus Niyogibacteria bacterium]